MSTLDQAPPQAANAYAALAPFYDSYTHHPAYADWILRLERLARRTGPRGRTALDVGCGTGKSTAPLLELGYEVTGCDPVQAMLDRARERLGPNVPLFAADVAGLPVLGEFDYVTCLNDVVNYLLDPHELWAAFGALAANLAPGGVLVFDASTTLMYRGLFTQTSWTEAEDACFVWRGQTPAGLEPGGLARAAIEVFERSAGCWQRVTSRHVQRHHPRELVSAALREAGLEPLAVYGQRGDEGLPEPGLDERLHTKAIYVVRKELR